MKPEIKRLAIIVHRTIDGRPTCAVNFETGKVYIFFRTSNFGTRETCVFAPVDCGGESEALQRVEGFSVPAKWCPLWGGEERAVRI